MCLCVDVCIGVQMPMEARKGYWVSRSWSYRQIWTTQHGFWEPNPDPLQVWCMHLTAEPAPESSDLNHSNSTTLPLCIVFILTATWNSSAGNSCFISLTYSVFIFLGSSWQVLKIILAVPKTKCPLPLWLVLFQLLKLEFSQLRFLYHFSLTSGSCFVVVVAVAFVCLFFK